MLGSLMKYFSMAFAHIRVLEECGKSSLHSNEDSGYEIVFSLLSQHSATA